MTPAFTTVDADLVFARAKPHASRRLEFPHFLHALELVAVGLHGADPHGIDKVKAAVAAAADAGPTLHDACAPETGGVCA